MKVKAVELRKKSLIELRQEMQALLREQFNLRMQRGAGSAVRTHLFKTVRRNIARINTLLQEKQTTEGKPS
ncbi:MAG: rpmC [Gammaproteobacteria bacterium]|jgi:large subunit ribosomal protein L29|nr:rpmC [Gammaproteobacteria bacterium]